MGSLVKQVNYHVTKELIMHRLRFTCALAFLFFASHGAANATGYTSYRTIDILHVDSVVYVKFSTTSENPDSCSWSDYPNSYVLLSTQAGYNGILSTLLAAYMANKEISLQVNGCQTMWSGGNGVIPKISRVYMDVAQ